MAWHGVRNRCALPLIAEWLLSAGAYSIRTPLQFSNATPAGKAQAAANGKRRQTGEISVREVQQELTGLDAVIEEIASIRRQLERDFG